MRITKTVSAAREQKRRDRLLEAALECLMRCVVKRVEARAVVLHPVTAGLGKTSPAVGNCLLHHFPRHRLYHVRLCVTNPPSLSTLTRLVEESLADEALTLLDVWYGSAGVGPWHAFELCFVSASSSASDLVRTAALADLKSKASPLLRCILFGSESQSIEKCC